MLSQLSHLAKNPVIRDVMRDIDAIRLAELGARASSICALTAMQNSRAKQIRQAVNINNICHGRHVVYLDTYIKNKKHRQHASFIIVSYRSCINLGLSHLESIIQAFTLYKNTLIRHSDSRSIIEFDHAFLLIQETNKATDYDLSECKCCKLQFFHYKYDLPLVCPFCNGKEHQLSTPAKSTKSGIQ